MAKRYFAAVAANAPPKLRGWGRHAEVHPSRYVRKGGGKRLYVWFFDKLQGDKALYAFQRHVTDARGLRIVAGAAKDLGRVAKISKLAKDDVGIQRAGARGSQAKRGVRRQKISAAKAPKKKGQQVFMLRKGLPRKEAYAIAKRRATRDFRGFAYTPSTGRAILT